jgi:uncharacterized protein YndB with AHSA1/START domain
MTSTDDSDVVEREVRIEAPPQVVYEFFTDPAKMVRWKGVDAALDPRPGGIYRVNVNGGDIAVGEYVELVPYSRIVLMWGWEGSPIAPGSTRVEIDFISDGDGTIVRLRHSGLSGEAVLQHEQGWDHYLSRLVVAASGRDAGPDPLVQSSHMGHQASG